LGSPFFKFFFAKNAQGAFCHGFLLEFSRKFLYQYNLVFGIIQYEIFFSRLLMIF